MFSSLSIALVLAIASSGVVVTDLEGDSISGQVVSWSDGKLQVATSSGGREIAEADVLSLRWDAAETAEQPQATGFVETVAGTRLPIRQFATAGERAEIELAEGFSSAAATLELPLRQIASVQLQPLSGDTAGQWKQIVEAGAPSDLLVISRQASGSLDHLEGVVREVTTSRVKFVLGGDELPVERGRVAGIVYYRREAQGAEEARCVVSGPLGFRIPARSVQFEGDQLKVTTTEGLLLALPLNLVTLIDFSAGKIVYLSDLEPASSQWTPLVGWPSGIEVGTDYGSVLRDRSWTGEPLALWYPPSGDTAASGRTEQHPKGISLRSRTELAYRLPEGYQRFRAIAGIDPAARAVGSVDLVISADGRELFRQAIDGNSEPVRIDLELRSRRTLTILVDYGKGLDAGDWLNLGGARLSK